MAPLVSVIMPCFNAGRMLEPAMWSVFAQSHPNIEFIFVDNNSTDGSAERALEFAAGRERPFHFARCAEQGSNHARNLGYSLARGDYIQWLDADDALGIEKIALQVDALERDQDAAIAYCDWMASRHFANGERRDQVNQLSQVDDQILRTLSGVWYPTHSYLIRREAAGILQTENAWPTERKIGTDVEYIGIAAMLGMRFRHVPAARIQYNIWSATQISGTGTPYGQRVASLHTVWRRLGEFARRPDVAPRITAQHRILLDQDWNIWAMPANSVEIATLSAETHLLRHAAGELAMEVGERDATIAAVLLATGLNRAICHHALQIASAAPSLRNDHPTIVATLERFRREGFLTRLENTAEVPEDRPEAAAAPFMPAKGRETNVHSDENPPLSEPRQATPLSTREVVAEAWTEVLRGRGLEDDEHFDAAGGDSLGLLNLALSCEARLGVPVSLDALSPRMRPSDLVRTLDRILSRSGADDLEVVADKAELPTIFLIRARHQTDPSEDLLRQACRGRANIVAIHLPPWPILARKEFDFTALREHTVAEVQRHIVGSSPVMLFGLCFGGMLAHAVATRLTALGRRIGFLAILDGDAGWALGGVPAQVRERALALRRGSRHFSGLAPAAARWMARHPRALRWFGENRRMQRLPRKFAAQLNWHLNIDMPAHFDRGGLGRLLSESGRLDAPVFLLRSLEQPPGAPADLHWRQLCSRLTVLPILGDHYHLFAREHAPLLVLAMANVVGHGLAAAKESPAEADHATRDDAGAMSTSRGVTDNPAEEVMNDDDRWAHAEFASPGRDA